MLFEKHMNFFNQERIHYPSHLQNYTRLEYKRLQSASNNHNGNCLTLVIDRYKK